MADETTLSEARVIAITPLTDRVSEFVIAPADAAPIAAFGPGAHILCEVALPDGGRAERAYSLVNAPGDREAWRIAVLHEREGRGGSRFMHGLEAGMPLRVSPPRNDFPLAEAADEHLLIAGGIGVTPILAMARALAAGGERFTLHYAGRDRADMAYVDEIAALPGARIVVDGGDPARGIDIAAVVAGWQAGRHLYVCGPRGLIEAVRDGATAAGWPADHIHLELFAAELRTGDQSFEVELRRSGQRLTISPQTTILEEMIAAGIDPLFDCKRGECGLCVVDVIDGTPDHRDINLSQREKDGGKVICTCVSRALTSLLVLDA